MIGKSTENNTKPTFPHTTTDNGLFLTTTQVVLTQGSAGRASHVNRKYVTTVYGF